MASVLPDSHICLKYLKGVIGAAIMAQTENAPYQKFSTLNCPPIA